jgi:hypothetical protein
MQFGNATTSIIKRNCFMRATLPTPTTDASLALFRTADATDGLLNWWHAGHWKGERVVAEFIGCLITFFAHPDKQGDNANAGENNKIPPSTFPNIVQSPDSYSKSGEKKC